MSSRPGSRALPASRPEVELEGSLGIVGRTGQLKRTAVLTARTPRKPQVHSELRRRPSHPRDAFAAVAQNALGPPQSPHPSRPSHVRTEPGGRLSLERAAAAGGVLDIELEGHVPGSQSMPRDGQELRPPHGRNDSRQDAAGAAGTGSTGRPGRRNSECAKESCFDDLPRQGLERRSSLPGTVPSPASEVIRKSLNSTLRKFEESDPSCTSVTTAPRKSGTRHAEATTAPGDRQEGEDPNESARHPMTTADCAAMAQGDRQEEEAPKESARHPMTMADCNELEGQIAPMRRQVSQRSKTGTGKQDADSETAAAAQAARAQRLSFARKQEPGEERDLMDLLPMPDVTGGGGEGKEGEPWRKALSTKQQGGQAEDSVDTFDGGWLHDAVQREEFSDAQVERRSGERHRPPMWGTPITSKSSAINGDGTAVSGSCRGPPSSERVEPPEPPEPPELPSAESVDSAALDSTKEEIADNSESEDTPTPVQRAPDRSRKRSKTSSRRPKTEKLEERGNEATSGAGARNTAASSGKGRRRSSRRHSKGTASVRVPGNSEEAEGEADESRPRRLRKSRKEESDSEPESAVTDNDLSEFLQELFSQYSTSRDKKGRPLMSNAGLRRFLQDFTFGPGSRPSQAGQAHLAAQADVRYDEEIERQSNMPTVFDLTKGDANRGLCFKSFDIVVNQVNMPCSSKEMTKRWFITYSYGMANPTPAEVAEAMYAGLH
ncbi:unnamed protein product [Symbiodinium sp. CCMP2592]|nr:unnamed protein product [Symbiodinium sp. CCMP2592]